MSEKVIVQYCSPTLAGLKTGNLFNCHYTNEKMLEQEVEEWNEFF